MGIGDLLSGKKKREQQAAEEVAQRKAAQEERERRFVDEQARKVQLDAERKAAELRQKELQATLPAARQKEAGAAERFLKDESQKKMAREAAFNNGRAINPNPAPVEKPKLPVATENERIHVPPTFVPPPSVGPGFTSRTAVRRETLMQKNKREAAEKTVPSNELNQQRSVLVRQIRERSLDEGEGRKR